MLLGAPVTLISSVTEKPRELEGWPMHPNFFNSWGSQASIGPLKCVAASFPDISKILRPLVGQDCAFGSSRHFDYGCHGEVEGTRGMANAPKFIQHMGELGLHWAIEMWGASFPDISKILRPLVGQEPTFGSSRHFDFSDSRRSRGNSRDGQCTQISATHGGVGPPLGH